MDFAKTLETVFTVEDLTGKAIIYDSKYVNFSSGTWNTAGVATRAVAFVIDDVAGYEAIRVFTAANTDMAAIAFYRHETSWTPANYISGIQCIGGTPQNYYATIPEGTKCIVISARENYIDRNVVKISFLKNCLKEREQDDIFGDELIKEQISDVSDSAIFFNISLRDYPIGTQFRLEITEAVQTVKFTTYLDNSSRNTRPISKGEKFYFERSETWNNFAVRSEAVAGNKLGYKLYEVKRFPLVKRDFVPYVVSQNKIDLGDWINGYWINSPDFIYNAKEWWSSQIQYTNGFKLRATVDNSEWYMVVKRWNRSMTDYNEQSFTASSPTVDLTEAYAWHIQIRRVDRQHFTIEDIQPIIDSIVVEEGEIYSKPFTHREFREGKKEIKRELEASSSDNVLEIISKQTNLPNPFIGAPHYYHFAANGFIKDKSGRKIIASESIEDVEIAARLGFTFIEANIQPTSDGHFICIHGSSGTFGPEVKSLDGQDAQNMVIKDTTLDYIKRYIRYASADERYCTTIPTLEEFCIACRKNNIGIFAGTSNREAIETCRHYLGENMIVYSPPSNIREYFSGYIFEWKNSSSLTVDDLIASAKKFGAPYMCGIGPSTLTKIRDEGKLEELVNRMHEGKFLVGVAAVYQTEQEVRDVINLGFDFTGSGHQVNPFSHNYELFDLDDPSVEFTGATPLAGIITLNNGEALNCGSDKIINLGKGQLDIKFTGTLQIKFGSNGVRTIVSDDIENLVNITDYFFRNDTRLTISAQSDAKIKYLVYKTSRC